MSERTAMRKYRILYRHTGDREDNGDSVRAICRRFCRSHQRMEIRRTMETVCRMSERKLSLSCYYRETVEAMRTADIGRNEVGECHSHEAMETERTMETVRTLCWCHQTMDTMREMDPVEGQ